MNPLGRLIILLGLAALLAVGGFFAYQKMQEPVSQGPDLTQLGRAPAFELPSHTGGMFNSASLEGRVWVVNFFFTRCRGICPILTQRFEELAAVLEPYQGWDLVSISVDPENDTPQVLTTYRKDRGITLDNWHFLTGEEDDIRKLIREEFLQPVEDNPGNADEPILHSPRMILLDGTGDFRGFYDGLDEEAMAGLKRDMIKLLQ